MHTLVYSLGPCTPLCKPLYLLLYAVHIAASAPALPIPYHGSKFSASSSSQFHATHIQYTCIIQVHCSICCSMACHDTPQYLQNAPIHMRHACGTRGRRATRIATWNPSCRVAVTGQDCGPAASTEKKAPFLLRNKAPFSAEKTSLKRVRNESKMSPKRVQNESKTSPKRVQTGPSPKN